MLLVSLQTFELRRNEAAESKGKRRMGQRDYVRLFLKLALGVQRADHPERPGRVFVARLHIRAYESILIAAHSCMRRIAGLKTAGCEQYAIS